MDPANDSGSSVAARLTPRSGISALGSHPVDQKAVPLGTIESPLFAFYKHWSKPVASLVALGACMVLYHQALTMSYVGFALVVGLLTRQLFSRSPLRMPSAPAALRQRMGSLGAQWLTLTALVIFIWLALDLESLVPREVLLTWFAFTLVGVQATDYFGVYWGGRAHPTANRHIIIGVNDVGIELARRVAATGGHDGFMGYFDFRRADRLPAAARERLVGACKDVAAFVQRHAVNAIYIALPMSSAPRIVGLVNEFRDTTASIYFVPDMFAFDLVHARCVELNGIPLLSVCDTPFHGMDGVNKRTLDVILATLGLLVAWPVMLLAALAVKLSSPGPVLFKQRRYGLHGEEILVYKFRSMTVWEDGPVVEQAKRTDARTTAVGRFLRRTSLDELPQLFNVLEGKMSFVGPRPHAVVHNEMYRKLISGYMIRHKVRPGITGWAQVHGLRGETATVEQMRLRAQYDLDYLRNWSLWLDAKILFRTALIVLRGHNAH